MLSQKQEGRKKALQSEKESSDARFQDLGHELAAEVADYQDEVSRVRRKALKDEGVRLVDDVAKQKESFERVTLQLDRLQKGVGDIRTVYEIVDAEAELSASLRRGTLSSKSDLPLLTIAATNGTGEALPEKRGKKETEKLLLSIYKLVNAADAEEEQLRELARLDAGILALSEDKGNENARKNQLLRDMENKRDGQNKDHCEEERRGVAEYQELLSKLIGLKNKQLRLREDVAKSSTAFARLIATQGKKAEDNGLLAMLLNVMKALPVLNYAYYVFFANASPGAAEIMDVTNTNLLVSALLFSVICSVPLSVDTEELKRADFDYSLEGKYGCHETAAKFGSVNTHVSYLFWSECNYAIQASMAATILGYFMLLSVSALNSVKTTIKGNKKKKKGLLSRSPKPTIDSKATKTVRMKLWWDWCGKWAQFVIALLILVSLWYTGSAFLSVAQIRWTNTYRAERCRELGWTFLELDERTEAQRYTVPAGWDYYTNNSLGEYNFMDEMEQEEIHDPAGISANGALWQGLIVMFSLVMCAVVWMGYWMMLGEWKIYGLCPREAGDKICCSSKTVRFDAHPEDLEYKDAMEKGVVVKGQSVIKRRKRFAAEFVVTPKEAEARKRILADYNDSFYDKLKRAGEMVKDGTIRKMRSMSITTKNPVYDESIAEAAAENSTAEVAPAQKQRSLDVFGEDTQTDTTQEPDTLDGFGGASCGGEDGRLDQVGSRPGAHGEALEMEGVGGIADVDL